MNFLSKSRHYFPCFFIYLMVSIFLAVLPTILLSSIPAIAASPAVAAAPLPAKLPTELPAELPVDLNALPQTVHMDISDTKDFWFCPDKAGRYTFQSSGSGDPSIEISDADGGELWADDDSGTGYNFKLSANFASDEIYLVSFGCYQGQTEFDLTVTFAPTCDHRYLAVRQGYAPTLQTPGLADATYCQDCGELIAPAAEIPALLDTITDLPLTAGNLPYLFRSDFSDSADAQNARAYRFTAPVAGTYVLQSRGELDSKAELTDSDFGRAWTDDDGGDGLNFRIEADLAAGETYYLTVGHHVSTLLARSIDVVIGLKAGPELRNPFADVKKTDWYYPYVLRANAMGLMTGTAPDTFKPLAKVTRGVFATVLYRLSGETTTYQPLFPDVKDGLFFSVPVTWAKQTGTITGYTSGTKKGNFGPGDNITREQIATILYRYAIRRGFPTNSAADLQKYTDANRISPFAQGAISWAVANGIIQGTKSGSLNPTGTASRAEIATIIVRFADKFLAK